MVCGIKVDQVFVLTVKNYNLVRMLMILIDPSEIF